MLQNYLAKALERAHYELMEDGRFWGEIPEMQGVWATGETLEACRNELLEVAEEWLFLKIRDRDPLPVISGIDLNIKVEEHADQSP